jgi:hypothetical protein
MSPAMSSFKMSDNSLSGNRSSINSLIDGSQSPLSGHSSDLAFHSSWQPSDRIIPALSNRCLIDTK